MTCILLQVEGLDVEHNCVINNPLSLDAANIVNLFGVKMKMIREEKTTMAIAVKGKEENLLRSALFE